jgi:nucleolar pre-ribosomal-associated protein 1
MPPIYSQLDQDPPITVFRVLTAIWDAITLSSPGVSRRISLALVNESSIDFLIRILGRTDIEGTSGKKVGDVVKGFLEGVTTNPGRGVCFVDDGWYPRELDAKSKDDEEGDRGSREDKEKKRLHNRILANVIRKVGARVIDDDGKLGDLVKEIVLACPELVAGYV